MNVLLYLKLSLELEALIAAGQGEAAAAQTLRDQMDAPWYALTEAEHAMFEEILALIENRPKSS